MEKLKEEILKMKKERWDVFTDMNSKDAERLLKIAGIDTDGCIEALNWADNGIHSYKFYTGKIDKNCEKEVIEAEFRFNGDVYASINRNPVLDITF